MSTMTLAERRETLVNSLRASKSWTTGYAEAFVDDYVQAAHLARPAQAVDVVAIREVIDELREWEKLNYCEGAADKLTRALTGEKAGRVDGEMALIPRHYASNIQVAACMMEQSNSVLDRREAPVLRKIAALLASPAPDKEG